MPSSANRKRLEIPNDLHLRLVEIAAEERRTVASVAQEIITLGLANYQPRHAPQATADRFTPQAKSALAAARDEAVAFNHHYVGTEHILLGLLAESGCLAARALSPLGIRRDAARDAVRLYVGRGTGRPPHALPWLPRAQRVMQLAEEEVRRSGSGLIGTGHLLKALIQVSDGVGARVLVHLGMVGTVQEDILSALQVARYVDSPGENQRHG